MVKIFRNIREKMVVNSSINKYIIYALGEILLVVIGILIALMINNKNEESNLNTSTELYVSALVQEINNNLVHLDYSIRNVEDAIIKSIETQTKLNLPNAEEFTQDELHKIVTQSTKPLFTSTLENSVFMDIISSGILNNIDNMDIKNGIFKIERYYQTYDRYVKEAEKVWDQFTMGYQINHFSIARNTDSIGIYKHPGNPFDIDKQAYVKNRTFTNQLNGKIQLYHNLIKIIRMLREQLETIIEKLKAE